MSGASATPRVLIFGGTFDPPHRAHVELPQAAASELGCDRIIYIPAAVNPLKIATHVPPPADAEHRLAMLRLALGGVANAEISTIELDRAGDGPSFTIDTLREIADGKDAASERHLLIGADQALDFHRWKDWRGILELATPAVMLRSPYDAQSFNAGLRERYDEIEAARWRARVLRTLPFIDITATEIRRRIASRLPVSGLVHSDVERYIRGVGLYVGGGAGRDEPCPL